MQRFTLKRRRKATNAPVPSDSHQCLRRSKDSIENCSRSGAQRQQPQSSDRHALARLFCRDRTAFAVGDSPAFDSRIRDRPYPSPIQWVAPARESKASRPQKRFLFKKKTRPSQAASQSLTGSFNLQQKKRRMRSLCQHRKRHHQSKTGREFC